MKLLIEFAREHPWAFSVMLVCLLLAGALEGFGYSAALPLVDLMIDPGDAEVPTDGLEGFVYRVVASLGLEPRPETLILLILGALTAKAFFTLMARTQVGYTAARVVRELRLRLVRAMLRTSWSYFVGHRAGTLTNAFASEGQRSFSAFVASTMLVALGLSMVVYVGLALAVDWRVTLISALSAPILWVVLNPFIRMSRRAGRRQTRLYRLVIGRLTDILQGLKPIKAMAREDLIAPLLEKGTQRLEKVMRKDVIAREAMVALSDPLIAALLLTGIYALHFLLEIEASRVALLAFLASRSLVTLNRIQRRYQKLVVSESAYHSLRKTIEDAEARGEGTGGGRAPTLERDIELREVTCRYGETTVFENVSLRLRAGRITALVGPSGAGKTSMVDMITGLVNPAAGAIVLDGVPLDEIDLGAWRRRIGYVPQEMFLLHESVSTNVSLGDPEVTPEHIEQALKAAHAWEFVSRLPEGVETIVGERGSALSGGQRQRIAIARGLLRDPWLLILDEATTALDPESEAEVLRAVEELRGRTTVLAISHQPALLEIADTAYRVADGRVAEETRSPAELTSVAGA